MGGSDGARHLVLEGILVIFVGLVVYQYADGSRIKGMRPGITPTQPSPIKGEGLKATSLKHGQHGADQGMADDIAVGQVHHGNFRQDG